MPVIMNGKAERDAWCVMRDALTQVVEVFLPRRGACYVKSLP